MTRNTEARDALPGLFLSIEGIDGAGKSTVAQALASADGVFERPVYLVRKSAQYGEGYVAAHAQGLQNILWGEQSEQERNEISDLHWLWLASSWYALIEHIEIEPRLRAGYVVVADSWFGKLLARFLLKSSAVAEQAASVQRALRAPACTIFLDVCPTVAAERKKEYGYSECGNFDGFKGRNRENFIKYQTVVRSSYLRLADENGWTKIRQPASMRDVLNAIPQHFLSK